MQLISLNIIVNVIVLFNITVLFLSSVSKLTKPSAFKLYIRKSQISKL